MLSAQPLRLFCTHCWSVHFQFLSTSGHTSGPYICIVLLTTSNQCRYPSSAMRLCPWPLPADDSRSMVLPGQGPACAGPAQAPACIRCVYQDSSNGHAHMCCPRCAQLRIEPCSQQKPTLVAITLSTRVLLHQSRTIPNRLCPTPACPRYRSSCPRTSRRSRSCPAASSPAPPTSRTSSRRSRSPPTS